MLLNINDSSWEPEWPILLRTPCLDNSSHILSISKNFNKTAKFVLNFISLKLNCGSHLYITKMTYLTSEIEMFDVYQANFVRWHTLANVDAYTSMCGGSHSPTLMPQQFLTAEPKKNSKTLNINFRYWITFHEMPLFTSKMKLGGYPLNRNEVLKISAL